MKMSFIVDSKSQHPVCVNVGGVNVTLTADAAVSEPMRISLEVQPAKKKEKKAKPAAGPVIACEAPEEAPCEPVAEPAEPEEAPAEEAPAAEEAVPYEGSALQAATHRLMKALNISEEDAWAMLLSDLEDESDLDSDEEDDGCLYP